MNYLPSYWRNSDFVDGFSLRQILTLKLLNSLKGHEHIDEPMRIHLQSQKGVYFLTTEMNGDYSIKIGFTRSIGKRIATLQCGCPTKIHLLHLDGFLTSRDEASLHILFRENRVRGEWFCRGNGLEDYILSRIQVVKNIDEGCDAHRACKD